MSKNILSGAKVKLLYKKKRCYGDVRTNDEDTFSEHIPQGTFIQFIQEQFEIYETDKHPMNKRIIAEKKLKTHTFCLVLNDENKIDKVSLDSIEFI